MVHHTIQYSMSLYIRLSNSDKQVECLYMDKFPYNVSVFGRFRKPILDNID